MDTNSSCSLETPSSKALQLPELLETVVSFLHGSRTDIANAALVCKAWSVIFTDRLWHTLDLPPICRPDFISGLLRHGNSVRSLRLIGLFDQRLIFYSCSQLQLLDLTLARSLDMISLKHMVDCLPRLKVLRLNCCYGQVLAWLRPLMGLEFLQELAFINDADNHLDDDTQSGPSALVLVHGGSDEGLEGSSDTSDTIGPEDENADVEYELMPVHDAMNSDNEDEAILKPDHLGDFLAARASTLKRLRFEGSDLIGFRLFETFNNTRSSAEPVANSVPVLALKYLNLSNTTINHPRSVVEPLLRQCPGLEILDISRNFDPPWNKFQWSILHQYCLKLTSLNLGGITFIDNDQLIQVVHLCPGLSSLIAFQSNLLNSVLDAIVDVRVEGSSFVVDGSAQQPASFLELDVSWCTGITQDAIERVLQHLPTLKSIKFSWCQHVNLSVFRRHWSCIGLEELEAQGLEKPAIGDQAKNTAEYIMFERICRFQSLRRLVIGSDDVNVSVANGFDQLRGNRGGVDDQKQRHLARLEYLELVGNEECPMGVAELAVIADILPRLCRFHFGLGLVTPEMQAWLSSKRPDIQQDEQRIYF